MVIFPQLDYYYYIFTVYVMRSTQLPINYLLKCHYIIIIVYYIIANSNCILRNDIHDS